MELVKDAVTRAEEPAALELGGATAMTLADEAERLKLEREVAQLRADLVVITKPWWSRGSIVASMTAIIAAILPATTAIQGHYEKERELLLQESKQAHEIRTSYLDRLDKPGARLRTLRFVLATTTDQSLRTWAEAETKEVQSELHELDQRIAEIDRQLSSMSAVGTAPPVETSPRSPSMDNDLREQRRLLEEKRKTLHKLKDDGLIDI